MVVVFTVVVIVFVVQAFLIHPRADCIHIIERATIRFEKSAFLKKIQVVGYINFEILFVRNVRPIVFDSVAQVVRVHDFTAQICEKPVNVSRIIAIHQL